VLLALALAQNPDLLLCDEPTTALDVTVQREVLDLLDQLRRERGLSLLFVSHDLAVVAQLCERVVVLHEGRVVESGTTVQVVTAPRDPYTRSLVEAVLPLPPLEASHG
jgi:peptide/nickel transport system permease protein